MNINLLKILVCPDCQAQLQLTSNTNKTDIETGKLQCCSCCKTYPVINGIPRFVESETYTASFGFEWQNLFEWKPNSDPKEEDEIFQIKTGWAPTDLNGKLILDIGCGSGRYAYTASRWGAHVIAVDLSLAVEKAHSLCHDHSVEVIQADIFKLPFSDGLFSAAYSIGVIHHTPNTKQAFIKIASKVARGGSLAVWVYRKNTFFQELLNKIVRARTIAMNQHSLLTFAKILAFLSGTPILNIILGRIINLGCTHPDRTKRICDAFDWYSPIYQWHHTPSEVLSWFQEAGFSQIRGLKPLKRGGFYNWLYSHNFIIGSGVNFTAIKN